AQPASAVAPPAPAPAAAAPADLGTRPGAAIKVLSGAAAGREVQLVKVVTTIGKPGVAVAAITRRPLGFVVAHVEGASVPTLNGIPVSGEPVTLKNGDLLELAGTRMQFMQA
ncbi:MAG: FHA domain-containing protein, partial [Rhodoferax sp.]|nr:FHA domain-containing protein [Rhodoferax sp.]